MRIKEECNVIVGHHPYADSLKGKLIEESLIHGREGANKFYTNIVGKKLEVDRLSHTAPSRKIKDWVEGLVRAQYHYPNSEKTTYETAMWFSHYDKGDYAKVHHHLPFALFSWVYFVNSPKGSAPLVFETTGTKIRPEEGKVIIFPSIMRHGVPKNNCKDRLTLVGNMVSSRVKEPSSDFMPGSSSYPKRGHYTVNLPL